MYEVDKIAVFDLDGTLWKKNSHYEILREYFKTNFYESFFFRLIRHFFPKLMYITICKKYETIPKEFANNFLLPFEEDIVQLLRDKEDSGYKVLIISNAPLEIVRSASKKLNVSYIRAPIGGKSNYLNNEYNYKELFVCTDNKEDVDLLSIADSYKIIINKNNKEYFTRTHYINE